MFYMGIRPSEMVRWIYERRPAFPEPRQTDGVCVTRAPAEAAETNTALARMGDEWRMGFVCGVVRLWEQAGTFRSDPARQEAVEEICGLAGADLEPYVGLPLIKTLAPDGTLQIWYGVPDWKNRIDRSLFRITGSGTEEFARMAFGSPSATMSDGTRLWI